MLKVLISVTLLKSVLSQCPDELADLPNAAFSASAGCLWADSDESHRFDNYEQAAGRCSEVFGPSGRLVEILSAEDQMLAVEVMKAAESMFTLSTPELSYWWSGLRDDDDDGEWVWAGSNTPMGYSDWHPAAVPSTEQYNCMQFLSGTAYEGQWMTFNCYDDFLNTHALCQLKLSSGPTTMPPTTTETEPSTTPTTPSTTPTTPSTTPPTTTETKPPTTTTIPSTMPPTTTPTTEPATTASAAGEIIAISFVTGSCIGCSSDLVEGGLKVRLESSSAGSCVTLGLDNTEKRDYQQGQEARFTTAEEGMAECENFPSGPPTSGSVTWTGSGVFAARYREICAEITAEEGAVETWCCLMSDSASAQNVQVSLDSCSLSDVV